MPNDDPVNPFCDYAAVAIRNRQDGPLADLTFGVKDLFDVEGIPTGAGSPEWLETHPVPDRTAPAVSALLDAGARFVGKTLTDEMAWSLNGQNAHYGTPANPAALERIPGGSSCGSVSATAAGLVDFALGSDTGGSVRLPASYCGIYGFRPTHGLIPIDGAVPLAPSYDTVGWFARDPQTLRRVGGVLLGDHSTASTDDPALPRVLIADDMFDLAGPAVRDAVSPALKVIVDLAGEPQHVSIADGALDAWRDAFRMIQSAEAWECHGDWITRFRPNFGPGVRERFAGAATVNPDDVAAARDLRDHVRRRVSAIIEPGTVLIAPTAPGPAPLKSASDKDLEDFRARALAVLCTAGHCGLPQVSIPAGRMDGAPIGLSLIGRRGEDIQLLDLACRCAALASAAGTGHA